MSRTACLGNEIIDRLYGKEIVNINFPKNRIDLLSIKTIQKIKLLSLYKMFTRYDILSNSIYMQNQLFYDKTIQPKAIFFDSFSELTDQRFTHKKQGFSFYCNFSDLNSDVDSFKNNIISEGLLEIRELENHYRTVFEKCIYTWGEIPIIFIHFPTKLDIREQFQKRGAEIKNIIEKLTLEYKNLHSVTIDESYVDFAEKGNEEYRKLPYHYNNATYEKFTRKIKELVETNG